LSGQDGTWDFLFVSDLHLSLGYDSERQAYHPREDFFFDAAFLRWLQWADRNRAEGQRWELVFVGDTFDFLPVDEEQVAAYFRERDRRAEELARDGPAQLIRTWRRQFTAPVDDQAPRRVQRLLFEDDVLRGWVRLEPVSQDQVRAEVADQVPVPAWALQVYRVHDPGLDVEGGPFVLRPLMQRSPSAVQTAPDSRPAGDRERRVGLDSAFERRYGFLPTPERSADKVTSIYEGHPVFFRALAWFVGRGHRVVFVPGNHDLELFWSQVRERVRDHIAAEYGPAFGHEVTSPPPPGFRDRIVFAPGWFYYRKGLFYAEHGNQYEPLNACGNPIRPVAPKDAGVLNPPVGSLGVICFHNHLEDVFPEWENRGQHAVVLLELLQQHPLRIVSVLVRHGMDFLRMAHRLWIVARGDRGPTPADFASVAQSAGLTPGVVEAIYRQLDTPLLMRPGLAWFLFSPGGHVVKALLLGLIVALGLTAGVLWYLVGAPALAGLIPAQSLHDPVGPALQLLTKVLLWAAPPVLYELIRRRWEKRYSVLFLCRAMQRVYRHLRSVDSELCHLVVGHDHRADVQVVGRRDDGDPVYCLNTGSWTPRFARGERRLQTLGQDVQFTFVRLMKRDRGYESRLMRWDDQAGRAERQVVPLARPTSQA
jgi:UDP-2,3-diacylglucosamine pyrophosphatase LpxH